MKLAMILRIGVLGLCVFVLSACEHIEEPWTDYAPQYKHKHFDTNAPDAQLRHRLEYTQTDR